MTSKTILLSLAASVSLAAQSELELLKQQLDTQIKMTRSLQKRIVALEKKEKAYAKTTQQDATQTAPKPSVQTPVTANTGTTFSQNAYLPDIALILDGSALGRSIDNGTYESYYIPGFSSFDPEEEREIPFNKNRGFNFNYAEVAMSSTVGPYFDATAIFHLHPDGFEIEEAYITSRAFPYGLRAKAGKFRSEFGRINAIHQHAWRFTQQPLVFEALLGSEGVNDAGVQLQWVMPTDDIYVMTGIEALQGENDVSFGDTEKNNLYVGYLKSSMDLSDTTTLLAGASILHGKNEDGKNTDIYGADLTLNTALGSYSSIMWQSEWLYREKKTLEGNEKQAGFYTQLIYQYNRNWSAGVRYDSLYKNIDTMPDDLEKYAAVLEYKPFEFTRFKLQYTYDKSKAFGALDNQRKNYSEILLDFTIEAGAHAF